MVSEQHCNFLINKGSASATDLENLGNFVQQKVQDAQIALEWEIKILGLLRDSNPKHEGLSL